MICVSSVRIAIIILYKVHAHSVHYYRNLRVINETVCLRGLGILYNVTSNKFKEKKNVRTYIMYLILKRI